MKTVSSVQPKYPIYVPSKGRASQCLTARFLKRDGVDFYLVVEEQEVEAYTEAGFGDHILVLPFRDQGLIAARNWIKAHSRENGDKRHWQLDDNIRYVLRRIGGRRMPCNSGPAMRAAESFVDRYANVAIAGFNYEMFAPKTTKLPPFYLNVHVYSFTLVLNETEFEWRVKYNDDTDMCLQVLAAGWCTMLFNAFLAAKVQTMRIKGGNTDDLYQGDGRVVMSRALERLWPGVVTTERRYGRPAHVVKDSWRKFDNKLVKVGEVELPEDPEFGMRLVQKKTIKSPELREWVETQEVVDVRPEETKDL